MSPEPFIYFLFSPGPGQECTGHDEIEENDELEENDDLAIGFLTGTAEGTREAARLQERHL